MTELLLHIGAHRTGTTSLQEFLRKNDKFFAEHDIFALCPPRSRNIDLDGLSFRSPRAIVSEENILGTMEGNIWSGSLYTDARQNLARYENTLKKASTIYLSIRNYADWWNSAIGFCVAKGMQFPSQADINKIAASERGWIEVAKDILETAPSAHLTVREYEWKLENPKQQIKQITRWDTLSATSVDKQPQNASPSITKLWEKLVENGDFESLDHLPERGKLQVFKKAQLDQLDTKYIDDIRQLKGLQPLNFLGDFEAASRNISSRRTTVKGSTSNETDQITNCFLCIGKTNSSWIRDELRLDDLPSQLYLGGNPDTLVSTARKFGRDRKLAFVYRDPASRFVSAFNSRLRQGRPKYDTGWTPGEAVAFSYFGTPNELAEALYSDDERMKSAARFAFHNIFHLKNAYGHYLHSSAALVYEHRNGRIIFCCADTDLLSHIRTLFAAIGAKIPVLDQESIAKQRLEETQQSLSKRGLQNLREFWVEEYKIYETCRKVANDLGCIEGNSK